MGNKKSQVGKYKTVFMGRDGTICSIPDSKMRKMSDFGIFSDVPLALNKIGKAGYRIAVVQNETNGLYRHPNSKPEFTGRIQDWISSCSPTPTVFASCVHQNGEDCICRLPKPYMITTVARQKDICLDKSVMIASSNMECQAAIDSGIPNLILLTTGLNDFQSSYPIEILGKVKALLKAVELLQG